MVAPGRVLFTNQRELFDIQTESKQMICAKLFKIELFDLLTACKQMTDV